MTKKLPSQIQKLIKQRVFELAEEQKYLLRSKNDNKAFLDNMVAKPDVGGLLNSYMDKGEIRTYIKDSILNQYPKYKAQESRPKNIGELINTKMGLSVCLIEGEERSGVLLFRVQGMQHFVIVADGTVMKWETALKKAMVYAIGKPFAEREGVVVDILLTLYARERKLPPGELLLLEKTLSRCNASAHVYGE